MAGRPPKNKVAEPKKVEAAPELKAEPETLIEETPKVDEVEEEKVVEEKQAENNDVTLVSEKIELSVFDHQPKDKLTQKYLDKVNEISDINELLHYIYEKAIECDHVTEFGVRIPTSTYALLAARPARVVSYDIGRYPQVDEVEQLCAEEGQDFEFKLENVLTADIEETDLLFIDDFHSESMLSADLRLHAHKVRKYILGHDFETYGLIGEQPYNDETSPYGGGRGIKFAVDAFLENNDEWIMEFSTPINNGLFILKRVGTKGRD